MRRSGATWRVSFDLGWVVDKTAAGRTHQSRFVAAVSTSSCLRHGRTIVSMHAIGVVLMTRDSRVTWLTAELTVDEWLVAAAVDGRQWRCSSSVCCWLPQSSESTPSTGCEFSSPSNESYFFIVLSQLSLDVTLNQWHVSHNYFIHLSHV